MPRKAEPRWYESRGGWYAWVEGRQRLLAKGKDAKAEAWRQFNRVLLDGGQSVDREQVSVVVLFDLLLDWVQSNREPLTYAWYRRHLQAFADDHGTMKAKDLTPAHVSRWLARKKWAKSTQHGAITAIKRAYRWGVRNRYLNADPIEMMERPGIESRRAIMTSEQLGRVLVAIDQPFRELLTILFETGMRPSEAYRLTAADLDLARSHAILARHKTKGKSGRVRVIYLTPRACELLASLAQRSPDGPLLRNKAGTAWTRHTVAHRFGRLRDKLQLGAEATAESLRHLFVTDALDQGVPIATVAELAGHKSTAMIERHYSHLSERSEHLKRATEKIRPGSSDS